MAMLFMDSFDHYLTAERLLKWTGNRSNACSISTGTPRLGPQCLLVGTQTSGQGIFKTLPTSYSTLVVGFAINFATTQSGDLAFFYFGDGGSDQMRLNINSSHQIQVQRGDGTTLATASPTLSIGVYYYIEFKVTFHGSTGAYELRIGEANVASGSGVDTTTTANNSANRISFQSNTNNGFRVDDLYVCDTSGSAPTNDFLGDVRIESIFPNGNGNSSQFDGSDGNSTDNYLLVDDTTDPDDDTTYVQSPDVGDKDTYAYGNVTPTAGTVYGVQQIPYARKTDAGTRSIVSVSRLSGTEVDSATKTLTTSYAYYPDISEAKPGGGVWTISDVNSAEFGYKVTA